MPPRTCSDSRRARTAIPRAPPKIPSESVDNVENPGRERARPVDNHSRLIVRSTGPLLESAPFHGNAIGDMILEKPLVRSGAARSGLLDSDSTVPGYPQSCQPFFGPSSTSGCPSSTANQFPTGPGSAESPGEASDHRNLHVRWMFGVRWWQSSPHMWKALWITKEAAVQRMSQLLPQHVNEASGYAFYLGFLRSARIASLWTIVWNARYGEGVW